jgi:hypothetical protein
MALDEQDPRPGDTDNNLLRKILLRLKSLITGGGGGIPVPLPVIVEPGDIEIGAVEIKDSASDNRATVLDSCPAVNDFGLVVRNIPCGTQEVDVQSWLGSSAPTVGSKTSANSIPVVIASDQSTIPVSVSNFPATQPVSTTGVISAANSSSTPLGAFGTFTGTSEDILGYAAVSIYAGSSPFAGTATVVVSFSNDNVTFFFGPTTTITAANISELHFPPLARYFKVTVFNGSTPMTGFNLQTIFRYFSVCGATASNTAPIASDIGLITRNIPSGTQTSAGNKSNNSVVPGATNLGVLPAVANAASPTWTETFQVALSEDLSGNLRTINTAQRGTLTDRSGTVATGGVSQQVMAANTARKYLLFENVSTEDKWINFTTAATAAQPSILIKPNGSYELEGNYITTEAMNVISASTSSPYTAKEG